MCFEWLLTRLHSESKVPVWPFLLLSFIGGAYALIPYFVVWKLPPPAIGEDEIRKWPFNLLESRITAWIHVMSLDFLLLSSFAPFWVYNDMTSRRWADKVSMFLPLSLVPLVGPALYVALRPRFRDLPMRVASPSAEIDPVDAPNRESRQVQGIAEEEEEEF